MLKSFDIYSQNNILKIIVALNLLLVGTGSLLYTDRLIKKFEAREEHYVQLYARSIAYLFGSSNSNAGDLTFVTSEILEANKSIPAIYVNPDGQIANARNISIPKELTDEGKKSISETENS